MVSTPEGHDGLAQLLEEVEGETVDFAEQDCLAPSFGGSAREADLFRPLRRRQKVQLVIGGVAVLALSVVATARWLAPSSAALRKTLGGSTSVREFEAGKITFACDDTANIAAEWSPQKRDYCCTHSGAGCPAKGQGQAIPPAPAAPAVQAPAAAPAADAPAPVATADSCSWEGSDCTKSKCCKRQGFSCWKKNEFWASCSETCEKLVHFSTDGKTWSCDKLGGSAHVAEVVPVPKGTGMGSSLFCFTVVTPAGFVPPGVHAGYEQQIIDKIKAKGLGIFQCDASAVFEGAKVTTGSWKSIVNTDIFIQTWKKVQADGQYKQHDWTVKVDTDAVFLPFRLKYHLEQLSPPADAALYVKNIDFKFGFMGSLEVISQKAVDIYLKDVDTCATHLGENGGEDKFTMACLDSLGVGHMRDNSLLSDKYMSGKAFHLFDVDPCLNEGNVAFHPYKHINSWMGCYNVAQKIQKPGVFVSCSQRFPDDACSLSSTLSHSNGGIGEPSGL